MAQATLYALLIPAGLNLCATVFLLIRAHRETQGKLGVWIRAHPVSTAVVVMVSPLNCTATNLLCSKLFGLDALDAPIPSGVQHLAAGGLTIISPVFEDIPQLVLQTLAFTVSLMQCQHSAILYARV